MQVMTRVLDEDLRESNPRTESERDKSMAGRLGGWISALIEAFKQVELEIDPRIDFPRDV